MAIGPFGQALMRYSRTTVPGGGARNGMRAPNADAIRMATPTPGAMKPSEAASDAALPPEIKAYLGMMTGQPGAMPPPPPQMAPAMPPGLDLMPPGQPAAPEMPIPEPAQSPDMPFQAPTPTVPVALRIRAPRPPDVDIQTLAITQPNEMWRAAFYDRNGRQPNASDQEQRAFVQHMIQTTGQMPTKAEMLFRRFQNFAAEPGGISEFS